MSINNFVSSNRYFVKVLPPNFSEAKALGRAEVITESGVPVCLIKQLLLIRHAAGRSKE